SRHASSVPKPPVTRRSRDATVSVSSRRAPGSAPHAVLRHPGAPPAAVTRGWCWIPGVKLYTRDDVLELAGQSSYELGLDYIDRVTDLGLDGGRITATVEGTEEYEVDLHVEGGLGGECGCPYGEEGNFCKHCVAVALVFLYHAEHGTLARVADEP